MTTGKTHKAYDLGVMVGRFQPFHAGHEHVVRQALQQVARVLILIGSAFEPRSIRNPWYFEEREAMIRSCFNAADNARIICEPLIDIRYNDTLWASEVQRAVYNHQPDDTRVTLVGLYVQGQGYYTGLFPQWGHLPVTGDGGVRGTVLRHALLTQGEASTIKKYLPPTVADQCTKFMQSDDGRAVRHEHDFVEKYKKGWDAAPFAPTHVTVDAVVIQSGHVLLVKRGAHPGKGLLALPGGFIAPDETLMDAMIRKLKEETQIKVPAPVLMGSIRNQIVFDAPYRSDRGRTITHAFHIELRGEDTLPKIKGGGEADTCFWSPLGHLDSRQMFEDHYFIIQKMVGVI